jgi:hypothetical protein
VKFWEGVGGVPIQNLSETLAFLVVSVASREGSVNQRLCGTSQVPSSLSARLFSLNYVQLRFLFEHSASFIEPLILAAPTENLP